MAGHILITEKVEAMIRLVMDRAFGVTAQVRPARPSRQRAEVLIVVRAAAVENIVRSCDEKPFRGLARG